MRTVNELRTELDNLVLLNPDWGNLVICYSSDDEGNSYQKIHNTISPAQVHNVLDYDLEVIGYLDEEGIDKENINALIIN